jgi:hypothetical protein
MKRFACFAIALTAATTQAHAQLGMPEVVGTARSDVVACMAPETVRSLRHRPVTVGVAKEGLVIRGRFGHEGCLLPTAEVEVRGRLVTLTYRTSGRACRGVCESSIRTSVRLEPGMYRVAVRIVEGTGSRLLYKTRVMVFGPQLNASLRLPLAR